MYKPVKHLSFDATDKDDRRMMIRLNAVAMSRGQRVAMVARRLLEDAIESQAGSVADHNEFPALQAMGS